jgi:hypothetical protein
MPELTSVFQNVPGGTVHRTIALLHGALTALGASMDDTAIERIGVMVHRAMSTQQRSFHTPEHIFDLSDQQDAHITLAAIFHDVVYYQVDDGFMPEIAELLSPYLSLEKGAVRIREGVPSTDRAFAGCAAVFGFSPGQELSPFGGLNEFLSALLMDVLLVTTVSDVDLLIATACIEETIPFRGPDSDGKRPPERLRRRLHSVNQTFSLGLSEEDLDRTVVAAVCFSNRDVNNFAEEDPGRFLDNTWKLLPESNPSLRFRGLYTIRNYSTALMKMEGFLTHLPAENVFNSYDGFPGDDEYAALLERTAFNLRTAGQYLGIKMITAGILLALADLTGGDAPVAFFMGDISPRDEQSDLAAFLPQTPACCGRSDDEEDVIFRLLKHGRASASQFDLKNSPLSLYVYRSLDDDSIRQCVNSSRHFLAGDSSAGEYLESVPNHLTSAIAEAASYLAFTRRGGLLALAAEFGE